MSKIFDNIEDVLMGLAKILFYLLLFGGLLVLVIGFFKVVSACDRFHSFTEVMSWTVEDYTFGISKGLDRYVEGYRGKLMMKGGFYVALSSVSSLPLYGFGHLLQTTNAIKRKLYELDEKIDKNEQQKDCLFRL